MKNYILMGMAALLLALLIPACQPEEPKNIVFEETLEPTELGRDPNLATLISDFTGQSLNGRTASTEMPFGTLDYNNIVVRIASEDQPKPNYTVKLIPPDSVVNSLEYLVLIGEEDGYWGYILQYQTDDIYAHTLYDLSEFTGTMHILNFDRVVQSTNHFENGSDITDTQALRNGRSELFVDNCICSSILKVVGVTVHAGLSADVEVDVIGLTCTCNEPSFLDDDGAGGGGRTYLPGQPIDDPLGGTSGGGGGSGGGRKGDPDGIEEPDNIGTRTNTLPPDIAAIHEDDEFLSWIQEDPDVLDCYNAMLSAGAYDLIRNIYDIKQIYSTVALVQESIRSACGDGESDPDNIHLMLDALGFFPIVGEGFDFVNGLLYLKEGDFYNAGFSFIAIVPVAGDALGKGTKYVIKVIKVSDEVFDNAKRAITLFKTVPKEARKLLSTKLLKLSNAMRTKLAADILADPPLLDRIITNPIIIDSWKFTDEVLDNLKKDVRIKYELQGTGDYRTVRGHHPTAKKAFEGDVQYNYNDAFSVSSSKLDQITGVPNTHSAITGQQNSLYSSWKRNNPSKKLTLDDLAKIEIEAMTNVGVPNDVARGWVIKAIEALQAQGITKITHIPWNGLN